MRNEPSPLVLETERLVLTLLGPEAASRMVSYFESNRRHLSHWEPPFPQGMFTNAFWERRLVLSRQEYRAGKSMRLALLDKQEVEGPVVGLTNFTQFVRGAFMGCTLGYSLDEDAEGKGLMFEALTTAIRHVFDGLGIHRVQANYLPTNERSGRLLRRLGFQVEGYARDYIFIREQWRDHILTAIVNDKPTAPSYAATGSVGAGGGRQRSGQQTDEQRAQRVDERRRRPTNPERKL